MTRPWLIPAALAVGVALCVAGFRQFSARSTARSVLPAVAPKAEQPGALDQEQREFLWQVEHHGNLLSKHGFGALSDALGRGDAPALEALLAPGFVARLPREPRAVRVKTQFVEVERLHDTAREYDRLDAPGFVEKLMAQRRRFARPPKVQTNLMLLGPADRGDFHGAWKGSCLVRMFGETGADRPGEVTLQLQYDIPLPAEETLRAGRWLRGCMVVQSQVADAVRFLLRDATAERGVDPKLFHDNWLASGDERSLNTGGAYVFDYNRDGWLDLLVVDAHRYALYRGGPEGKLVEVTTALGLPTRPTPGPLIIFAGCADLDGDGWEDLFLGDRIYRNRDGQGFDDYTDRTNLKIAGNSVTGIAQADYDRDGRVDLYVTSGGAPKGSWLENTSANAVVNVLWRNKGNWQFEDVTQTSGTAGGHRSTFSAAWLDADNDAWPDLYVINEFGTGVLLVNQKNGTFREAALGPAPNDFGSMGLTVGDFDNDGNIDLYTANMYSKAGTRVMANLKPGTYPDDVMAKMRSFVAGSQLWRNKGGLQFEPLAKEYGLASVGWAYGPALLDLDNDGWLDISATCGLISQSRSDPDG